MSQALTAFMDTLIDYAGLFPPATLDVPTAVAEYARHRSEPEAWMLGRFIAPSGRLDEIAAAAGPLLGAGPPWGFSVLVGARDTAQNALSNLAVQAEQIALFEREMGGRAWVQCLEAALPPDGAATAETFVPQLLSALSEVGLGQREIFLEILPGGDDAAALAAISQARAGAADDFRRIGAKLRCGGMTADAFPTCERIAEVIQGCVEWDLALKCTAGLHHPVRHRAVEPDVMMHGFLNVFGAGVLAWAEQPAREVLVACLEETDPAAFTLSGEYFAWREHRVSAATTRRIRSRALCGFGSCSFAEPRADLQTLGVL
jgi:hypothetical protein